MTTPKTATEHHLVASGTGGADTPPMLMVRSDPGGTLAGICTFTWHSPMKPGVKPENDTGAATAPILAVAWFGEVGWRLVEDAGCPVTMAPATGPNPVA